MREDGPELSADFSERLHAKMKQRRPMFAFRLPVYTLRYATIGAVSALTIIAVFYILNGLHIIPQDSIIAGILPGHK